MKLYLYKHVSWCQINVWLWLWLWLWSRVSWASRVAWNASLISRLKKTLKVVRFSPNKWLSTGIFPVFYDVKNPNRQWEQVVLSSTSLRYREREVNILVFVLWQGRWGAAVFYSKNNSQLITYPWKHSTQTWNFNASASELCVCDNSFL